MQRFKSGAKRRIVLGITTLKRKNFRGTAPLAPLPAKPDTEMLVGNGGVPARAVGTTYKLNSVFSDL